MGSGEQRIICNVMSEWNSTPTHTSHESRELSAPTHVVGVGASAGGLEPLECFFENLPNRTGMAFVVIQHLSPDFKSLMDELLARRTDLPILLVENGMPVEPDHIYLIPPKKEMIISGGRLLLSERSREQELTLPIDVFFRSLAQDCRARGVAIVLSGGGSDGSRGIRDVHEAGGLVLVQSIQTAQFDSMPRSAIDAGVVDLVLPPEEMPQALLKHAAMAAAEADGQQSNRRAIPQLTGLAVVHRMLQDEFGLDFTHYKPSTVTRRIERRLALARSLDIEEYIERLKHDHDELDVLYRDLLIGVTRFFRDEKAFDMLEKQVLPELLEKTPQNSPVRLWVAGCATGEEAYSFAIVLSDLMAKRGERPVKIFATDVHRGSLERAARAIYDDQTLANVSEERLDRYFLRAGESYQVVPDLRQMVVFAQHNVIKDAPFTRIDLVSCRNLLIYLQPPAQQKVLSFFHFALNREGILLLGPSESTNPFPRGFEMIDKQWQLYRKHSDVRTPVDARLQPLTRADARGAAAPLPSAAGRYSLSQLLGTYDAVLDEVMPPSLLVGERGELIHAFAGASSFLRLRDGRQGLDVLELVDDELKMVLIGGLKRALNEPSAIVFKGVRIGAKGEERAYKVSIRRIGRRTLSAHLLVSFEPVEEAERERVKPETEIDLDQTSRERLTSLEVELSRTKESLQAAIEERGASNEELQASNEELQASNEELQSTNEELQSVNEELYTVNAEYQRKISELTELANDMDNLLSSTEVGTIFLDRELKIRKFTPQIADTFDLVPHDIGRPIDTFAHRLDHPELVDDLRRVVSGGERVERELDEVRGRAFFLRILPYRARGTVEGVVLTLIDVSGLKAAEDALFHERYLLNSLLASIPDAIYFKDARGKFIRANHAMAARLGLKDPSDAVGKTALDLPDTETALALHRQDEDVLKSGQAQLYKLEQRVLPDGHEVWDLVTRLLLRDGNNRVVGIAAIFRDVTEQRRAEKKIEDAMRRRDQFLAMLSHELRNPLGAMVTATSLLKGESASPRLQPSRLLGILDRQSQQMARLLDDLLEVSRVTQGKIELKRSIVDLRFILGEAADAMRTQMETTGIAFSVDIGREPIWVDGDPARLHQIQVNLLTNAAKYTPAGGQVALFVRRDRGEAVIRVCDDGMGIPADMLDSVFDLFVQSTRTLDRAAGGLGVGLTLVRSLVAMHGGTVTARSDGEGKGSEFVVRLPLADQETTAEPALPLLRERPQLVAGAKIVVVEDNADSRELLCELLEQAGFECRSADAGLAALHLIDEVRPQIAILDVGLPEMDGFEVARRIRANTSHADMWLIALTGYGQAADREVGRNAGFDEHLVKPVDTEQLLQILIEMRSTTTRKPARVTGQ